MMMVESSTVEVEKYEQMKCVDVNVIKMDLLDEEYDEGKFYLSQVGEAGSMNIVNISINEDITREYILPDRGINNDLINKKSFKKFTALEKVLKTPKKIYEDFEKDVALDEKLSKDSVQKCDQIADSNPDNPSDNNESSSQPPKKEKSPITHERNPFSNEIKQSSKFKRPYRHHICEVCGRECFNDESFRKHLVSHGEAKYQCDLCNRKFKERGNLRKHVAAIHSEDRPYICHLCGAAFKRIDVLKQHIDRVHEKKEGKSNTSYQSVVKKRYQCPYCNKSLLTFTYFKDHVNGHLKKPIFTCRECDMTFSRKASYRYHFQRAHVEKKRTCEPRGTFSKDCEFCGLQFRVKKYYELHVAAKHYHKFLCHHCDEYFDEKTMLQNHMETDHADEIVRCEYCGKVYPEIYHLKRHIYLCHNENRKRYWCNDCGHEATKKSSLVLHMRKHTKEKPFECDICRRKYSQVSDFRKHRVTHFKSGPDGLEIILDTLPKQRDRVKCATKQKVPDVYIGTKNEEKEGVRIVEISTRLGCQWRS